MKLDQFSRSDRVYGWGTSEYLSKKKVILFGAGGVGSYIADALIRTGLGHLHIVDPDIVDITNINRQLQADHDSIGHQKCMVLKDMLLKRNPHANIRCSNVFVTKENIDDFPLDKYDYVIEAVDTVEAKLSIIEKSYTEGVKVISSMGAGNKIDPTQLRISPIKDTEYCPLARVMRRELMKKAINDLPVLWSPELPIKPLDDGTDSPGSSAFVPPAAGLCIAARVVEDLVGEDTDGEIRNSYKKRR